MIFTTANEIPGRNYEIIGLAMGNTIQTRNIGRDITQGLRSVVGKELVAYNEMLTKAREIAVERMGQDAMAKGADAVIAMRITTSMVMAGAAEILAYGTAVRFV
ncbi:hypothetical protein AUQ37_03695 [Candidatus Methanomethylophilus sp. 1R26]|jgi:uncharacterized protein YbjQ (UPF0145 family)|uniref:heavy metal-binding domain-containing protein n=1 Tax=Candidatus Methanomethylophilus sp. 1R26 TaxID=1769296 RepID=UPI000736850E|nr:heavy metal-binding domain-containing protein [Candidatus Methanomethylophilus sp. 1R26]KUE73098.1 hypothetical protein AUQ37_03695 [Candidatus Methanomethylophilus sp. 1R26]MEE3400998.1 heavy metal-binding domain-containing protein [Methanomethylophilus sp.]TQS81833.1 MAG: hypothetical protein A3Q59_04820 [Methanomethylophilus alvi]